MSRLQAIFFDLDDTLVDDQASFAIATARVCADLRSGLDEALLTRTYVAVSNDYWRTRAYAYGDLYEVRLQLWQRALALCGSNDGALAETARDLYTQYRTEICEVYEGTAAVLQALAGTYRLGVVTNGHGATQRNRLRLAGLDRYLDVVVAATDIDAGKPDPAIFAHALERLGLQPDEAWHVGDNLHSDIAGALNAKLAAAVWLNHRAEERRPDHPLPHHEIGSLPELPGLLS